MSKLRAGSILTAFLALTVPLMPVQWMLIKVWPWGARHFPHWYHRQVCRLIGIKLEIEGGIERDRPVLLISNHTSWLDIPVLSAVAPVSFIAKKEVGTWPFVSWLAKLQRSVFIDRQRRSSSADSAHEIADRLKQNDAVVLFAEGTSSDGNRVLPFLSTLFAAAMPSGTNEVPELGRAVISVQTIAIVYTKIGGVQMSREQRPHVGWYGDMEMTSHAWKTLGRGPLDVAIRISPPVALSTFKDRKELARYAEQEIRQTVVRTLRGLDPSVEIVLATAAIGRRLSPQSKAESGRFQ
jgi:lyso-ornithine lipid O-acyltransferase